jgi:hypothetical protein
MLVSSILWVAEIIEEWAHTLVCSFLISCGICYVKHGTLITLVCLLAGVAVATLTIIVLVIRNRYYDREVYNYIPNSDPYYYETRREIGQRIPDDWDPK